MIPPTIRAVWFDAVGTLIHPTPGAPEVYAHYAARHGLNLDAIAVRERMTAAYMAEESIDAANGWATSEAREVERWRTIVAASLGASEACFQELYAHFAKPGAWRADVDAAEVFAELAGRGLALGLASNYDSRLFTVLDGLPALSPLRARVIVSSVVGVRKPGRGFFELLAKESSCDSAEIAYVGDDYGNDYLGAGEAGMYAILLDDRERYPDARRVLRLRELLET